MRGFPLLAAAFVLATVPTADALPSADCDGVVDVLCEERTTVCEGELCYTQTRYCLVWVMHVGVAWPFEGEPPVCMAQA